jgi:AcrR family transcriptional regulator
MDVSTLSAEQRRNRNFAETHRQLIERAVELIVKNGADKLSVASLARDAGMNRSTVYYHFDSREALIDAVKAWIGDKISKLLIGQDDPALRLERTVEFVMTYADVVHLWISDILFAGGVREGLPFWDGLVHSMGSKQAMITQKSGLANVPEPDAEVWSAIYLSAAMMGPRLYKTSLRPNETPAQVAARFRSSYDWLLHMLDAPR